MNDSTEARLTRLEEQVAALEGEVQALKGPSRPTFVEEWRSRLQKKPEPRKGQFPITEWIRSGDWMARVGIALLLLGLVFLFKYGIDRGWLTPLVRVIFGGALSASLLVLGLRLTPKRTALGQVLLGGAVATLFVTVYAAYHFYGFLAYGVAFAVMAVASVGSFALSLQHRGMALSLIATLGGLGTPFLLYTGEGSIAGLMVYTCIVLAFAAAVYLSQGWRTLLCAAAVGGWVVALNSWVPISGTLETVDKWAAEGGLLFSLVAFGIVPVLRDHWSANDPERWVCPPIPRFVRPFDRPALFLTVLVPLATLGLSAILWETSDLVWTVTAIAAAAGYAVVFVTLRPSKLASAHAVAASLLFVAAWSVLADMYWHWYAFVAVQMATLHVLSRTLSEKSLRLLAHLTAFVVAGSLLWRLLAMEGLTPALVHRQALIDLAVIGLFYVSARTLRLPPLAAAYTIVAYAAFLVWLLRDLVSLPSGHAFVSIAWGVCALALLALGWRLADDKVRTAGLLTLGLVVGKLFLVDLSELDAVWRILLFLGFGGLFLVLGYLFPSLWKPARE